MEIKLNHANVIPHAIKWKKDNNIDSVQLKEIVDNMINSDEEVKFHLVKYLEQALKSNTSKNRYHKCLQNDFEFRIGIRKDYDMSWWEPPIRKKYRIDNV